MAKVLAWVATKVGSPFSLLGVNSEVCLPCIHLIFFQILELARLLKILGLNPKIHNGFAHLAMYNFLIIKFQQNVNLFGSPYVNLPLGSL